MGAVEEFFNRSNILIANTLLLIFAALALIDNDIAMAVFVYKRIAAQPLQVALTQAEKHIQRSRFAAVTAPLVSATLELTGRTNRLANIFDRNTRGLADRHQIIMNRGCRFSLGFELIFIALNFVLADFA